MMNCCYDLAVSPPTYEIVSFLMRMEQERLVRGEDEINITISPGPVNGFRRDGLWPHTIAERHNMMNNVVLPICNLLPSCKNVRFARGQPEMFGRSKAIYGMVEYIKAYRDGIRPLKVKVLPIHKRFVTITLRESLHWPERNSNVIEWVKAAHGIKDLGYDVVFVRDTLYANVLLNGFEIDINAARNIVDRAALYGRAVVNLGISNGPMWMALAMDAPVIMMKPCVEDSRPFFSRAYFKKCGVDGDQLPGAPRYQILDWHEDTSENIMNAFFKNATEFCS